MGGGVWLQKYSGVGRIGRKKRKGCLGRRRLCLVTFSVACRTREIGKKEE